MSGELSAWKQEQLDIVLRAFEPLPDGAVCGLSATKPGSFKAREYRLRRAVELLREAGRSGVAQAMLRDLVRDPKKSPLLDDLTAAGATRSYEHRPDFRGRTREQVIWRIR